ncbi:MAG: hypothetical protein A3F33_03755 [Candidatus Woykebacteria bacterium RIFCSPHIGHO2_12_FULL_43_10]|uniref:Uncharacterized protein n=2 Tax=Candidatus Woykeibacteriota TaxID=1817899 RepID=A0A1G1WVX4_9BACT|nr:MAG: hypothetical protein A2802_01205 [Candidatus Woykebacteria bacterium RIFCSPHIGHO2_01_FULL_43_29]OGY28985.1 MAG: hypothetical protein A3J50_03800 [Candidatus Woykebacteria bacterium RIFCSPHIGHO2_02_FULL_43_16b]OGY30356.1 MAG: hypothetical protein A3F33_03755 [Candidatus Woykebacteria bacterium RIFCSPHIGHO2_12_FULL_43_10]OGY31307.1 MAG: hypothetical protein A3A61_02860 [Candidatus Woykebacteria bacterium RIFCSPLOWO2_01_FULL_43_14]
MRSVIRLFRATVAFGFKLGVVALVSTISLVSFARWLFKKEFGFNPEESTNGHLTGNIQVLSRLLTLNREKTGVFSGSKLTRARMLAWFFGYSHRLEITKDVARGVVEKFGRSDTIPKEAERVARGGSVGGA